MSTAWAGVGPIHPRGWSHPAPSGGPASQARRASQGLSLPLMPRKNPSLFLYQQVDLNLKDLLWYFAPQSPSAFISWEKEHWEEHSTTRPLVDLLTRKSLALTLGTSPGHFDVVFWSVLGLVPLLLCPGLYCMFFPRLHRP